MFTFKNQANGGGNLLGRIRVLYKVSGLEEQVRHDPLLSQFDGDGSCEMASSRTKTLQAPNYSDLECHHVMSFAVDGTKMSSSGLMSPTSSSVL